MSSSSHRASLFVIATYLALSLTAFLPLAFGTVPEHPWRICSFELICWSGVWALCKRPVWFHWLLLPAFLALPVEIYLRVYYGQGISVNHLGIIAETSPREAAEFLGGKIWLLAAALLSAIAWWAFTWRMAGRTRALDWTGKSRLVVLTALVTGINLAAYGQRAGIEKPTVASSSASIQTNPGKIQTVAFSSTAGSQDQDADSDDDEEEDDASAPAADNSSSSLPRLPRWAAIPLDLDSFSQSWPFGLAAHGYEFWKERRYLRALAEENRTFRFGAHEEAPANMPQVVVMVIGESSRYDRWSLNGYERETNPLLKQEKNLVSLPDVVTAVSATRLSVPVLVSRKPATQSLKEGFAEKSFITAFKEAGFKTYWISNQMTYGEFDTPVSVFANEADVTQFLNLGSFTNASSYDRILLDPLKAALDDPARKKLIVLHTLGSHWNYSHRYPQEFDRWKPSLFGVEDPEYTDLKIKPELNNSYDNSVLYTDWFLAQVIGTLKSSDLLASMIYVSDHGQTLYDGSCDLVFHGHNTQFEFHVPALVWYSDLYQRYFPSKVESLLHNQHVKLATENMFHSLLDMADIHYQDERPEWSLFSKKLKRHKRYVDSYGWSDYDNSTFKGDCREVIDKGKPLAREE